MTERIKEAEGLFKKVHSDVASVTKIEETFLRRLYTDLSGLSKPPGCGKCLIEICYYIKQLSKTKIEQMKKLVFKLKTDAHPIGLHGMADAYTNANLTNKAALTILKKSPGHIKDFEEFPENWKELVDKYDFHMDGEKVDELIGIKSEDLTKTAVVMGKGIESSDPIFIELNSKTKAELYSAAENMELPKSEYGKKNKTQMVAYLLEKVKA